VYALFGDKPGLVRAMFAEGFRRLARRFAELDQTDDPLADLAAMGEAFRANAMANPHLFDLMFGCPFPDFRPDDDEVREALGTFEALVAAVRRCLQAGVIAPVDPEEAALTLFGLVQGLANLEMRGWLGAGPEADRRWAQALGMARRGLA
jgi:AcrR family transcriptional regulator